MDVHQIPPGDPRRPGADHVLPRERGGGRRPHRQRGRAVPGGGAAGLQRGAVLLCAHGHGPGGGGGRRASAPAPLSPVLQQHLRRHGPVVSGHVPDPGRAPVPAGRPLPAGGARLSGGARLPGGAAAGDRPPAGGPHRPPVGGGPLSGGVPAGQPERPAVAEGAGRRPAAALPPSKYGGLRLYAPDGHRAVRPGDGGAADRPPERAGGPAGGRAPGGGLPDLLGGDPLLAGAGPGAPPAGGAAHPGGVRHPQPLPVLPVRGLGGDAPGLLEHHQRRPPGGGGGHARGPVPPLPGGGGAGPL